MGRARGERDNGPAGPSVLSPVGDLDLATGSSLVAMVEAELAKSDTSALVIDLGEVEFMDSSGLRALLQARDRCEHAGRALRLARLGPSVSRIIDVVALRDPFEIVDVEQSGRERQS